ncbi:hypothetical protein [Lentzea sp. NEAU-D7]|uniref:hypothetical protein n=1 Tax=Lentzea sp. NEAU-D7 TaxID=2994667 RepID=UPI00224B203A|nr:hypothetical protein [Lentzea sp. NEAU-D7]MCX2950197.1 hypothetical protein [Lentzea sp. NEAU-D7]
MIAPTMEELRAPDERTQHCTPFGLGITHMLTPEAALAYQHTLLTGTDLVDEVAEGTRQHFEALRTLYLYGVLRYEFFTLAGDTARLVVEHALRDRFLAFYEHRIVQVHASSGLERTVDASTFDQVLAAFKQRRTPWRLKLAAPGKPMVFDGMLSALWEWARREGLLPGQRARSMQRVQVSLRNIVAHPSGYHLGTPGDAARVIRDLAEIINCLWGVRTPGGRLHPAPVHRSVLLIAWDNTGRVEIGGDDYKPTGKMAPDSTCVLVRAVAEDLEQLLGYDPRFESTHRPVQLLWGPGSIDHAHAWTQTHQPEGDKADMLDRHFAIRHHGDHIDPPRSTAVTAGLPTDRRSGTWFLVKADDPLSAFNHIRNQTDRTSACARRGECRNCPTHTVAQGDWRTILQYAAHIGLDTAPLTPPEVQVPSFLPPWTDS